MTLDVTATASLPSWLPEAGQYARAPSLNTLRDVQPVRPPGTKKWGDSDIGGSVTHYAGATFAPDYSPLGAIVIGRQGGNMWWGNNVAAFDFSTLAFSILVQPSVHALAEDGGGTTAYDNSSQQALANNAEWFEYADGSPATRHIYTMLQNIPASWGVTGPKGGFVTFGGPKSSRVNAHWVDLADPYWRRFSDKSLPWSGLALYPATTRDDYRQCFYYVQSRSPGYSKHWTFTKDGVLTLQPGGGVAGAAAGSLGYAPPPYDVVVSTGNYTVPFKVTRPDNWVAVPMNTTGPVPSYGGTSNGLHPEWCPDRGCFVFWSPVEEKVYKLYPPSGDPVTGVWSWVTEQIAPSLSFPPQFKGPAAGGQWSKLRRIPALKAFAYMSKPDEVQVIRPSGA